jgi:hypothetical protein
LGIETCFDFLGFKTKANEIGRWSRVSLDERVNVGGKLYPWQPRTSFAQDVLVHEPDQWRASKRTFLGACECFTQGVADSERSIDRQIEFGGGAL